MYGSGIQTPTVSFSSITLTKIAVGSFFFGFDSDNGGAFSKIDRLGNLTVIEGASAPITGAMVISALGFTPYDSVNPASYIDATALIPYQLDLGFTPYDSINPDGFISGITSTDVTTALGFTPYDSINPDGFISGITSTDVTTALGFTPYDDTNPAGYIDATALIPYQLDLGFTPYDSINPDGFIDVTALAPYQLDLGFTPEDVANKDIDGTLAANSDALYPSQKAVKTYIDASVTGVLDDRGNWDASSGSFPSTGGSGPLGAILKGDLWFVSVPGTLGGNAVVVGSNFRALIDNPVNPTDWNILNSGVGYIPEDSANKGIVNGYASLDLTGKVPITQLPIILPRVLTITTSATPSINTDLYDAVTITGLTVPITSMTAGLTGTYNNFQKLTIRIKDAGVAKTIFWGASYASRGVNLPTTTTANKVITIGLIYNSEALTWDCVAVSQEI
jgi:hypothetical protein